MGWSGFGVVRVVAGLGWDAVGVEGARVRGDAVGVGVVAGC